MGDQELTLYGLVKADFKRHVNKLAVLYDDGESRTSVSYKDLWDVASQIKTLFPGRENEVVGVCLKIDHRMPAILLGILGCDMAFYNLDVKGFTYAAQVLEELGAQNILIHQMFIQDIQGHVEASQGSSTLLSIPYLEDYVLVTLPAVPRKKHPSCLAYCITTSGTTGKPKVVMVPSQCIVPNIVHLRQLFSLTSSDLVLGATALTFDPSIVEIFMTLSVGACLLIVPPAFKMMPDVLLDMIHERNKVTVVQMTPALLSRFNANRLSQTILGDNSAMRVIALGGERFPSCTWLRSLLSPSNRTQFYNLYGTTEVSCWATCYHVTEVDLRNGAEVPLGEPLLGTVVEVQDDAREVVTEGEGRFWIGGRERQCLLNTTEELQFDKLVLKDTGDIVSVRGDGKLFYVGRRDLQTKRNGQRIDLEEIKMVGRGIETVHDCEVVFIQDQLVVFIMLSQGTVVKDVKVIEGYMKQKMPSHWWPDSVMLISNMPITEHGKVDFISLEKIYRGKHTPVCTTSIADYLALKWKEFVPGYRDGQVQETDNFILTGGDSLKAVQLAYVIENCLSLQLPMLIDKILHKTYREVREYLTHAFDECVKQCVIGNRHITYNSKNILNFVNEKAADIGKNVNETDNNFEAVVDKGASESDDRVKVSLEKRKLAENHVVNKIPKFMNNFQFSISRCNRITELMTESDIKGDKRGFLETKTEKNQMKTFCAEENRHFIDILNNELSLEDVWRYDTGKCVDASPLVAVKSSGDYLVMIGSHSHRFAAISGSSGEKQWEITLPDRIESSACLSRCGNFVIVGCYDGKVYILYVDTGEVWWQLETGSQVKCSPVMEADTGLVYIGSHSQMVYCLNVNERVVVWQKSLESGSIFSSPAISFEPYQLYVATLGGKLFSLNPTTGAMIWEYSFQKPVFSSLTVTENGVLVGCTDKHLYRIKHNGELIWKFLTDGLIFSTPSVFKRTERVASLQSEKKSDEAKFGCEKEASTTGHSVTRKEGDIDVPSMNENIIVGSHDKCLYCISNTGELVWKLAVDSEVYSSPFQCNIDIDNTNINCELKEILPKKYFQNQKENDEETVTVNARSETRSNDSCSSTVSETVSKEDLSENNMKHLNSRTFSKDVYKVESEYYLNTGNKQHVVVFATTKGTLYIVHGPTGRVLCRKHLEGEVFSSPVVYKNNVIVGCRNDFVYCFKISQ